MVLAVVLVLVALALCALAVLSSRSKGALRGADGGEQGGVTEFRAHFDAEGRPMDFESDLRKPANEQELL